MPRPLDPDERAVESLLSRAGLRSPEARCLVVLMRGGIASRVEVARATDLAPQDVSDAMRALAERGAAVVERVAREGPGRPQNRYRLAGEAREVVAALAAARRKEIEGEQAALDALVARF